MVNTTPWAAAAGGWCKRLRWYRDNPDGWRVENGGGAQKWCVERTHGSCWPDDSTVPPKAYRLSGGKRSEKPWSGAGRWL